MRWRLLLILIYALATTACGAQAAPEAEGMAISDLTGLVGHWRLDGDGVDAHTNGYHLTTQGPLAFAGPVAVRNNSVFTRSATFPDSSDRYLYHEDNADLSTGDIDFTIAAVFKVEVGGTGPVLGKVQAGNNVEFYLWYSNGDSKFNFAIFNAAGTSVGHASITVTDRTRWHLAIGWHDAANNLVWIQVDNGTPVSVATTGAPTDTSCRFQIGVTFAGATGNVQGVSYWKNRILTSDERTALWNDGYLLDYPFDGSPFAAGETGISYDGRADDQSNAGVYRDASLTSIDIGGTRYQATALWHHGKKLVLGKRTLPGGAWTLYTYDGTGGLADITAAVTDSHGVANIGIDQDGYLHVAYDMHGHALKYRKSDAPINSWTGALTATLSMLGTNETSVTYPSFVNAPDGTLYFRFRQGSSSDASIYFYVYDEGTATWAAAPGTGTAGLLIAGVTSSVYVDQPVFDADFGAGGRMHLSFMYRDTGVEGWDYTYVTWDGTSWYKDDGTAQTVPITTSNNTPFDPATTLLNQNSIDIDAAGNPHIAYWKDGGGGTGDQLFHAHHDGSTWTITQLTSLTGTDGFNLDVGRPQVIVARGSDTVYIVYRADTDPTNPGKLLLYVSDPGDFTTWAQQVLYNADVGGSEPSYDRRYWESDGLVHLYMAPQFPSTGQKPVSVFEWEPEPAGPGPAIPIPVFMYSYRRRRV
jgi:hypothetical protein